jgi:hypothetical protein
MRPLYMEPVACLDKCRVTFYWVIKYTIRPLAYLVPPHWERGRDRLLGVHIEHIRKHRRWKPLLKALPMKMAWKGQITSEGLEKDKVIIECPREHPKDTSGHVTSRGSPTGDVWWRHFRSRLSSKEKSLLPVAHTRTPPSQGNPLGLRDVWWRHFRWKVPTRVYIVQLPVAHGHTSPSQGNPFVMTWRLMTSFPVKRLQ